MIIIDPKKCNSCYSKQLNLTPKKFSSSNNRPPNSIHTTNAFGNISTQTVFNESVLSDSIFRNIPSVSP